MNKYRVRVEIAVGTTDLAYMIVKAPDKEAAIEAAIASYGGKDFDPKDLDRWTSDGEHTNLKTDFKENWEVEELE